MYFTKGLEDTTFTYYFFFEKKITSDCRVPPKIDVTSDCVDALALAVLLNRLKKNKETFKLYNVNIKQTLL